VERGDTVIRLRMMSLAMLLALWLPAAAAGIQKRELVLIVSARSDLSTLGSAAMRKLFLGITVTRGSRRLRPLLNVSDPLVREVFLQNVVSMSDANYDRRMLRLTAQEGRPPPDAFKNKRLLFDAVADDPDAVSYAWRGDVEPDPRIHIIRVIWSD